MGDTIQKVRSSAEEAFLAASGHPQFGVKSCLNYITNDIPVPSKVKKGKKPVLTSKHLAAKQSVLYKMLLAHSFTHDQLSSAAKYAVKGIGHSQ